MAELREEPWVVLPGGFAAALPNRLNTLAMSAGFVPRIAQTAPDSWTLMVLVAAELGCAVTLDSVRDNTSTPGVAFRSLLGDHAPLEVRLIWRRMDATPALRTVLDIADRILAPTPPR
jgi:DNA-binding transcriptional LysR family regulator